VVAVAANRAVEAPAESAQQPSKGKRTRKAAQLSADAPKGKGRGKGKAKGQTSNMTCRACGWTGDIDTARVPFPRCPRCGADLA
jgi:hypothetical protein